MSRENVEVVRPFLLAQLSDPHIGAEWADGDPVAGLAAAVESVRSMSRGSCIAAEIRLLATSGCPTDIFAGPSLGSGSAEGQEESRSLVWLRLCPDPSSMLVCDPLHHGQASPVALELIDSVKSLKQSKELPGIGHLETDSIVFDGDTGLPLGFDRTNSNRGPIALPSELDCISQEMAQSELDQSRICVYRGKFFNLPVDSPRRRARSQLANDVFYQRTQGPGRRTRSCRPIRETLIRSSTSVVIRSAASWIRRHNAAASYLLRGRSPRGAGGKTPAAAGAEPSGRGDGVQHSFQLCRHRPNRRATFGHPPFQFRGLAGKLFPQSGVLDGDCDRRCHFQSDFPVLRVRPPIVTEPMLISPIASPSTSRGTDRSVRMPSADNARCGGGGICQCCMSSMYRTARRRSVPPGRNPRSERRELPVDTAGKAGDHFRLSPAKSKSTTVQRWQGTNRADSSRAAARPRPASGPRRSPGPYRAAPGGPPCGGGDPRPASAR